jgi:hypothetical protein
MPLRLPIVSKWDGTGVAQAESALSGFGRVAGTVAAVATAALAGIAYGAVNMLSLIHI